MRQFTAKALIFTFFVLTFMPANTGTSYAAASVYESITGTDTGNLGTGNAGSTGFTGDWFLVNSWKSPNSTLGVLPIYSSRYNSNLKFPANSSFTLPGSNTAATTVADLYTLYYAGRQLSSGINFDSNGNYYFSFLNFTKANGASWGSAMMGLINGKPASSSDNSYNGLFFGRTYSGAVTVQNITANQAVWNSTYSATGTTNNPAAPDGNSYFVVVKITTASSGSDQIRVRFFNSTDTMPLNDSSITWDVTYSSAITGTYSYLTVQNEYNGTIDEIRGDVSYAAVTGVPVIPTIGSPTVSGTPNKGIVTTLTVTVGASGYFRFYVDGKRIPACLKRMTSGTAPNFSATCLWKPPVSGVHRVYADFTSTDSAFLNTSSPFANFQIGRRSNTR